MKTFQTQRLTGLDALAFADAPTPEPEAGEITIALEATAVSLGDLAVASGRRGPAPALPFTPGMQGAGTVLAAGKRQILETAGRAEA